MTLMKTILGWFLFVAVGYAAQAPLDRTVRNLRFEAAPLPAALRTLARVADLTVVIEPEVTGEVTQEIAEGSVRTALEVLLEPRGYHFEESPGRIVVRSRQTVLYAIDYPSLTRSGSGSASITLGGGASSGAATSTPANGAAQTNDATQVSISQENQSAFWNGLEAELKAMLKDGDQLVLNRFSGVAQVTAPRARQEIVRRFLGMLTDRVTRQVEIEARIVEVALRDERKLGIDWDLAATSVGKVGVDAAGFLQVGQVGGATLAANTFAANLGYGRASAVIKALQQQGEVKTVAQPRLRTLNNQSALIKVGQDQPFFRLQQSTTFQQGGTTVPVNQTQENYTVSTLTIGTILSVTPQIDADGMITLDVLPAITRLQSIVTSPDGRQTAPVTEVKQASTIVRMKDGETAIIGGLISEENGRDGREVPGLARLPLLGRAFRASGALHARTELVIFLTPKLVR
jgi:MSHA biogenesis protein MshL